MPANPQAREIAEKIKTLINSTSQFNLFDPVTGMMRLNIVAGFERIIAESLAESAKPRPTHTVLADKLIRAFDYGAQRGVIEAIVAEGMTGLTAERDAYKWMIIRSNSVLTLRSSRDGFTMKGLVMIVDENGVCMHGDDDKMCVFRRDSVEIVLPSPPPTPHGETR